MEPDRVLAAFDAEVRRSARPDGSGARIEADPLSGALGGHRWPGLVGNRLVRT